MGFSVFPERLFLNYRGSWAASKEVWCLNGMAGFLVNMVGEVSVTIYNAELSTNMATDIENYMLGLGVKGQSVSDRRQLEASMSSVLLKEHEAVYIPFGMVHTIVPLPSKRDSKTDGDMKVKKKPGRSGKKDETEHSSMLFLPHLSEGHATQAVAGVLAATTARWMDGKPWSTSSWDRYPLWQASAQKIEAKAKECTADQKGSSAMSIDGDGSDKLSP